MIDWKLFGLANDLKVDRLWSNVLYLLDNIDCFLSKVLKLEAFPEKVDVFMLDCIIAKVLKLLGTEFKLVEVPNLMDYF